MADPKLFRILIIGTIGLTTLPISSAPGSASTARMITRPTNFLFQEYVIGTGGSAPSPFAGFVEEIEAKSTWTYSGETDLIITNSRYDPMGKKAFLDFTSAIALNLDEAKRDKAIGSAANLLQSMFAFAQKLNEDSTDPAWDYSDKMGFRIVKSSLKQFLMRFLPPGLNDGAKQAFHFVVKDISPKTV